MRRKLEEEDKKYFMRKPRRALSEDNRTSRKKQD